jgi:dihydropteroate synthase
MARELTWNNRPLIMGVVNVTPDSFFDGGRFFTPDAAIRHGLQLVGEGADILDVGGESTRPYAESVSAADELTRVLPVIRGIRAESEAIISIDTYKAEVAERAIEAGADVVNDISGLTFDSRMADVVASTGVYTVLMHIKGVPGNMQKDPFYEDVIKEIKTFLEERALYAERHGVARNKIILDPGIGFGKRVVDNLKIIKELRSFKDLGYPVLIGTSMKAFIGQITDSPVEERMEGTLASVALALWNGADIVRVHDVGRAVKVLKLVEAVKGA